VNFQSFIIGRFCKKSAGTFCAKWLNFNIIAKLDSEYPASFPRQIFLLWFFNGNDDVADLKFETHAINFRYMFDISQWLLRTRVQRLIVHQNIPASVLYTFRLTNKTSDKIRFHGSLSQPPQCHKCCHNKNRYCSTHRTTNRAQRAPCQPTSTN